MLNEWKPDFVGFHSMPNMTKIPWTFFYLFVIFSLPFNKPNSDCSFLHCGYCFPLFLFFMFKFCILTSFQDISCDCVKSQKNMKKFSHSIAINRKLPEKFLGSTYFQKPKKELLWNLIPIKITKRTTDCGFVSIYCFLRVFPTIVYLLWKLCQENKLTGTSKKLHLLSAAQIIALSSANWGLKSIYFTFVRHSSSQWEKNNRNNARMIVCSWQNHCTKKCCCGWKFEQNTHSNFKLAGKRRLS